MTSRFDLFHGDGRRDPSLSSSLPQPLQWQLQQPGRYLPDDGLRDACNVSLLLGQPLLLTGEPGTGKSRFAHALAWEFGLGEPLRHAVKSTSQARSLFYHYDALKRFQDIQSGIPSEQAAISNYITFSALGEAILRTMTADQLPPSLRSRAAEQPARSVVLIDEIDKAPRDFPNDLLLELEDLCFDIPELDNLRLQANRDLRPLLVLTSNSERDLPDPFLRRCVYYNIPFPDQQKLAAIVAQQLEQFPAQSALVRDAIDLFLQLRQPSSGLTKKPATAELLLWLLTLQHLRGAADVEAGLRHADQRSLLERSLSSVIKTADDRGRAGMVLNQWLGG